MDDIEVIDADHKPLAIRQEPPAAVALFAGEPSDVITQAVKVADALKAVVKAKGLVKSIQGREFIEVAGWQTLGAMTRVTPFCEWSRPIEGGGWEARVVVKNAAGLEIGAAEAQCSRKEKTWSSREDFALRSMAQTRATSKALRSVLGFIVVLAGYADTPAEEMPAEPPQTPPEPKERPARPIPAGEDEERRKLYARIKILGKERGSSDAYYKATLRALFPRVYAGLPPAKISASKLGIEDLRHFAEEFDKRTRPEAKPAEPTNLFDDTDEEDYDG